MFLILIKYTIGNKQVLWNIENVIGNNVTSKVVHKTCFSLLVATKIFGIFSQRFCNVISNCTNCWQTATCCFQLNEKYISYTQLLVLYNQVELGVWYCYWKNHYKIFTKEKKLEKRYEQIRVFLSKSAILDLSTKKTFKCQNYYRNKNIRYEIS